MRSHSGRLRFGLVVASCLTLALAIPVMGHTSASISPSSQTVNSGQQTLWFVTWNVNAATQVVFCYGDGTACPIKNTTGQGATFSHKFYTCVYNTYSQTAYVTQGHTLTRFASTSVRAGTIC